MKPKSRVKDLTGLRFGKLVVKEFAGIHTKSNGKRAAKWLCSCDCGRKYVTQNYNLQSGDCKSCGCIKFENVSRTSKTTESVKSREVGKIYKTKKIPRFTYLHDLPVFEKSDKEIYSIWSGIRNRVGIRAAYLDCTISEKFQDFEFFLNWYRNQFGSNLGWEIDKDLLVKGNREYGEGTCILLPREVNMALSSQKSSRGALPRGVTYDKSKDKYAVKCSVGNNKQKFLGKFDNIEDAFLSYKNFKELLLKSLAFKYKGWLDPRAYKALMEYEITGDS